LTRLLSLLVPLLLPAAAVGESPAPTPKAIKVAVGASVKCTIRAIHGLQAPGGIDKRLSFIRRELSRPQFSAYKTIKLLEAKEMEVPQGGQKQLTLPTGKILKLTFKERLLGRKDRIRLRLHLSITPPNEKRYLPGTLLTIANRGTLLVAGDKHQGGMLIVGITCQAK
jgi:hypothetical protein